jgi:hypothetical protein
MAPLAPKLSKKKMGSGNWPIAKLYTKRRSFATLGSDSGGTNLSAPSYPDYIPYLSPSTAWTPSETNEPVPSIPNTALLSSRMGTSNLSRNGHSPLFSASRTIIPRVKSPATPPAIVGLDSTAERWVQENTYGGNNQVQRTPSSGSRRSGHSDISLSRSDAGSPIPHSGVTQRAQIARRSNAHLWPLNTGNSNQDIPLRNPSSPFIDDSIRAPAAAVTPNQTVPVSASLTTTSGLGIGTVSADSYPSYIRSSPHQSTSYAFQTPHLATYTPNSSGSPTRSPRPPTPATASSHRGELRRGVSVKSAKSLKSLFSGWQRPTHDRAETPARPDSGIFPALGLGSVNIPLHTSSSTGSRGGSGDGSREGANMFIELDPESPLTASRPPSEWPRAKVWVSGAGGRV